MSNDNELDEILEVIRKRKELEAQEQQAKKIIKKPQKRQELDGGINEQRQDLEPPVRPAQRTSVKKQPLPKKSPKKEVTKSVKKAVSKTAITIIVIIVLVIVAGVGSVFAYNHSQTAYLKPYAQKYKVDFPKGIIEEMCDAYGKNQDTVAVLEYNGKKITVTNDLAVSCAKMLKGSTLNKEQDQFTSIDTLNLLDLEKDYSTPKAFLKASQEVTLTSLYEKSHYAVVSAYYTNVLSKDDNGYVFPYDPFGTMTDASFSEYRDRISTRQLYSTGRMIKNDDKVLVLTADTEFENNYKFVVVLVKFDGEMEKSTTAVDNNNIHFPQSYFENHNGTNTFIFSSKWYPEIYTDQKHKETKQLKITDFE